MKAVLKDSPSKKWLEKYHWYYSKILSYDDESIYTYRFPVYKYGTITTLDAELALNIKDRTVLVNVFDGGTRALYAPFYYSEYGKNTVVDMIIANIKKEMKKMNIEVTDDNSR